MVAVFQVGKQETAQAIGTEVGLWEVGCCPSDIVEPSTDVRDRRIVRLGRFFRGGEEPCSQRVFFFGFFFAGTWTLGENFLEQGSFKLQLILSDLICSRGLVPGASKAKRNAPPKFIGEKKRDITAD